MNRSVLIVICDFLLVSLLAFSTVDINKVADGGVPQLVKMESPTNQAESGKDLAAVMNLALTEERKKQDLLLGELRSAQQTAGERGQQTRTLQEELRLREEEGARLQQQHANLQQQYADARTNLQTLSQRLQNTSRDALISKEKLAAMEAELKKQAMEAASLQQQLSQLSKSNQLAMTEKQQLSTRLQVAEVEKRSAAERAARMQEEVKIERAEKARLAEGVKALASNSGQLAKEIHENRPLVSNTIFDEFVTNRVEARFVGSRPGLLGMIDMSKNRETQTVLVTDGTNIFALCHVQNTPLSLGIPGVAWQSLTGTLRRNQAQVPIRSLSFHWPDPRVVLIPVTAAEARSLGSKIYTISSAPFKFQDAVLISAHGDYYGECRFEIDPSAADYVKLDNNFLKGLFGKFNPSRGDLVFSKSGEFLGVMANNTYCVMIRDFEAAGTIVFGPDVRGQHTADMLSSLYSTVSQLPNKLQ